MVSVLPCAVTVACGARAGGGPWPGAGTGGHSRAPIPSLRWASRLAVRRRVAARPGGPGRAVCSSCRRLLASVRGMGRDVALAPRQFHRPARWPCSGPATAASPEVMLWVPKYYAHQAIFMMTPGPHGGPAGPGNDPVGDPMAAPLVARSAPGSGSASSRCHVQRPGSRHPFAFNRAPAHDDPTCGHAHLVPRRPLGPT